MRDNSLSRFHPGVRVIGLALLVELLKPPTPNTVSKSQPTLAYSKRGWPRRNRS